MSTEKPREIAVRLLKRHTDGTGWLEDLLEAELSKGSLAPADRALVQELAFGVVRWQATLDWLIALKTQGRPQKTLLQILLRLGLYQLFWLDRIPDHAAVHESVQIARDLGLRLPVQGAKGYSITVRCPADFGATPIMLSESKVFITPMGEVLRFGGTLELAGLDLSVNLRRVRAVERAVARVLPGVESEPHVETWRGLRPLTPDDRPILGRPRELENLVIATGHGMSGISQGVISGKLVAELVAGERTSLDLAPFSPDRFG